MLALTWLCYIVYISAVAYYVAKIYGKAMVRLPILCLLLFINAFPMFLYTHTGLFRFEPLLPLGYFLFLAIEIFLCYRLNLISTVAATLCFTINYFGMKVLNIGILSLIAGVPANEYITLADNRMLVQILTFSILSIYIAISSKILIHSVVKYLFADIPSLKLCCVLLAAVLLNQTAALPTLYTETSDATFSSVYQIRVGMLALICFVIIMIAVFVYSKLRQASISFGDTSVEIHTDNVVIHKLEKEVLTDFFTGFFVRSIAVEKLKGFLALQRYCYVLFIDLDGLKTVNDTFGHEEGDIYIKLAADFIKESFAEDTISRIGGDEFLIIGNSKSLPIKNKVEKCYQNILGLNKVYETSISYGFIEVDENNTLSHDELIERADKEMYSFKKERNKERRARNVAPSQEARPQ